MFIRISKSKYSKDSTVYLAESYRDKEGKTKQRTIKNLGKLSELTKDNPNAIEELKVWAKEETEKLNKSKNINVSIDLSERHNEVKISQNYGYIFIDAMYRYLGIDKLLKNASEKLETENDLNHTLKTQVIFRSLFPSARTEVNNEYQDILYKYKDINIENMNNDAIHISKLKDDILYKVHKKVSDKTQRDCKFIMYNLTNYYFEPKLKSIDRSEEIAQHNEGHSKTSGIVQMGLFVDSDNIPITYVLFKGNTPNFKTMQDKINEVRKKFNIGNITFVGYKRNNTSENIRLLVEKKDKYVFGQAVKPTDSFISNVTLNKEGYVTSPDESMKYKKVHRARKIRHYSDIVTQVDEHFIPIWTKREQDVRRSNRRTIHEKVDKYIHTLGIEVDYEELGINENSNDKDVYKVYKKLLKNDPTMPNDIRRYITEVSLDGYQGLVTNNLKLSEIDAINCYNEQSQIESRFNVVNREIDGTKKFYSTDEEIEMHFLICFVSVVIFRLIQKEFNNEYSVRKIRNALNSASVIEDFSNILLLSKTDDVFANLLDKFNVDLNFVRMREEDFKKNLSKIKSFYIND